MELRLIGDAGTGKTSSLLRYVQNFDNAIMISHTTTAAGELLSRMKRLLKDVERRKKITVRTLHSLTCSIYYRNDSLFRDLFKNTDRAGGIEAMRARFCKMKGLQYTPDPYTTDQGKRFFSIYSKAINTSYPEIPDLPEKDLEMIMDYEEFKLQHGYLDYEDMLKWAVDKPDFLPECSLLVVDEAQDLSPLQLKIVKAIEADATIVAGDELQAIFSFQGSEPELFVNMQYRTRILEKTYRIPKTVWDFAGRIVENQLRRKRAKAVKEGGKVKLCKPMSLSEIARFVSTLEQDGKKMLLLVRHNIDVIRLSSLLHTHDVEHDLAKEGLDEGRLILDTIHATKGMEADRVVLVDGVRTGQDDKKRRVREDDEEARVWYVGATRAKDELIIVPLRDEKVEHFVTPIAEEFVEEEAVSSAAAKIRTGLKAAIMSKW